jgi:hypothetical protein
VRKLKRVSDWLWYVTTPRSWPGRWQDRLFRGHVTWRPFGVPITIYGANAMHWAVNVQWRGEYWCFHPRTRTFGGRWPAYFYISRDATPHTARVMWGRDE